MLSEWIIHHKSYFHEKRILELGAGTGLSSLVAGKCCDAKSVKVSDGNEKVLEILEENFSNNFERCEDRGYVNEKNGTKIGNFYSFRYKERRTQIFHLSRYHVVRLDC